MQMKLILIRHGKTEGNIKKCYIGRTDEPLCDKGIKELYAAVNKKLYPKANVVFVSPMLRCIQTAEIIFDMKETDLQIKDGLRECDFGQFEGRNYKELSGNPLYQQWIDSGGKMPFPEGENVTDFKERCCLAFAEIINEMAEKNCGENIAIVVHGGTIMSVMERFCGGDYYDYMCENAEGYICNVNYEKNQKISINIEKAIKLN
jgi:alpha-ribazole phosphatase